MGRLGKSTYQGISDRTKPGARQLRRNARSSVHPPIDDHPSTRRALETWFLSLPFWTPDSGAGTCVWCLNSPFRRALPEDVPLTLVHELVVLLEREVARGVELRATLQPLGDEESLDRSIESESSELRRVRLAWRELLALELARERRIVDRALDLHVRPVIAQWLASTLDHLPVADEEGR